MKMTIYTRNRGRGVTSEGVKQYKFDSTTQMGESGYANVKEMQKELCRRFPNNAKRHTRNRRINQGLIRVEGPRCNRTTFVITLT